jgi:DNA-binding MarR family transcriptional regulator
MDKNQIHTAFQKVKEDINNLKLEINSIQSGIKELSQQLTFLSLKLISSQKLNQQTNQQSNNPTIQQTNDTNIQHAKDNPTDFYTFKDLKGKIYDFSTGNEGVPTNKQTNKQTNQQTDFQLKFNLSTPENPFASASELISSLDAIKKGLRKKLKSLTDQEFLVLSAIYQLGESEGIENIDFSLLASKLHLSESSIRDYIGRLILKEIPICKTKINNKKVILSLSPEFKKLISLQTLAQLREI